MSTVNVSNQMQELASVFTELEALSNKLTLNDQERRRMSVLLAKQSMLRQGVPGDELRRAELHKLLTELGRTDEMPEVRATGFDAEWRDRCKQLSKEQPGGGQRANVAGTQSVTYTEGSLGGYLTPTSMSDRLYESMKNYDQIFDGQFSNIVNTDTGSVLPVPAFDDVASAATILNENTSVGEVDIANFGITQFRSYKFATGKIIVSLELEQDNALFPWASLFTRVFSKRFARGIGAYLVNGSGTNQPTGIIPAGLASGATIVVASGSANNTGGSETGATSVGTADLAKLYGSLNAAYRPGAVFAMNDSTLIYLMELVDKYGTPIIKLVNGLPTLYGKPIAVCPSMPGLTATSNSIVFYNPDYFIQRREPGSCYIRRYTQAPGLAENYSVAYQAFLRTDSNLIAPNSSYVPVAILQNHS